MSSEINISPADIQAVADSLDPIAATGSDPLDAAMQAMARRPAPAVTVRVVLYRFDRGASAQADTYQAQLQAGSLPLHAVAQSLDCDLQAIELGRGDTGPADTARAAAFGMMAAEQDTGLLAVGGYGAESDARAAAIDSERFFETATPEVGAVLGAMLAAARAGIPIIAEGPQGRAAALALRHMRPDATGHVFLCGIGENVPGFAVFGDAERNETGYAAAMLAATLQAQYAQTKEEAA